MIEEEIVPGTFVIEVMNVLYSGLDAVIEDVGQHAKINK
jgi:hypothetical protein